MSEMVELVVETEAQVGVTGFSVTGGGKEGIFVKQVLKDSRAAKALHLKEGDQLLCAKVYFDNAKYEDVVRILQSAEPYKVAFCLKRTVPSADVAISPETGSLELRGPEAKKTKLSVKSISPVKKTRQLMKGKMLSKDEAAVELDVPVDVEFAFPRFSRFKRLSITSPKDEAALKGEGTVRHPEVEAELSFGEGQVKGKKKRIRFPGFRASDPGKVKVEVGMEPKEEAAASAKPPQAVEEDREGKKKMKVPSADLTRKGKVEAPSPKAKVDLKDSAKAGVMADGEAAERKLLQAPKLELDIGLPKADVEVKGPSAEGEVDAKGPGFKVKMPSLELKGVEGTDTKRKAESKDAGGQVEGSEGKLKMPAIDISVPKIKPCEEDVTVSGVEIAVGSSKTLGLEGKIKEIAQMVTTIDISAPKVPDVDISLQKVAVELPCVGPELQDSATTKADGQKSKLTIEGPESRLKMPKVSLPEFGISAKGKEQVAEAAPEVSGPVIKMPKVSLPEFGISAKGKEAAEAAPEVSGPVIKMPKVEVSMPKVKLDEARADVPVPKTEAGMSGLHVSKVKLDIKGPQSEDHEARMKLPSVKVPTIDIAMPKVTLPDVQLPVGKADAAPDGKTVKVSGVVQQPDGFDLKLKVPKVSLPKLSAGGREAEADTKVGTDGEDAKPKAPMITMPKFEIAVPRMKPAEVEVGARVDAEAKDSGFTLGKLPGVKMPSLDISAPKVKIPDVNVQLPSGRAEALTAEGGAKAPKGGDQPSESSLEGFELQLKVPKVSLPSFGTSPSSREAKAEPSSPKSRSAFKVKVPEVDVCLPKGKADAPELVAATKSQKTGAASGGPKAATEGPEVTLQIPKVSLPKFDISIKGKEAGAEVKEAKETDADAKCPALKMPKCEVAVPKLRLSEAEVSARTAEADVKGERKSSKGKIEVEDAETKVKMPSVKLPTIDLPALQVKLAEVEMNLPSVKSPFSTEGESKVDGAGIKVEGPEAKVKMPKVSLPKFDLKGKGEAGGDGNMPEAERKASHIEGKGKVQAKGKALDSGVKADVDVDDIKLKGKEGKFKMPKIKMPSFGTSRKYEEDVESPAPSGRSPELRAKAEADGSGSKLKIPKVEMPSVGISVPDVRRPRAEVDVSEVDLKAYGGELKIPKVKVGAEAADPEGKQKLPSVKMPAIDISMPKVRAPEVDLSFPVPKIDTTVRGTEGEASLISSEADEAAFKLKMPKLELPKFGVPGSKGKEPGEDASSPGVGEAVGKGTSFKAKMPKIDISLPKVKPSDADVDMDASLLEAEAEERFKMPAFTLPKISPPKLRAPEIDINFGRSKDKSASSELKADTEESGAEFKLKMPQVALPSFGLSGAEVSLPVGRPKTKVKEEVKSQLVGGEGQEGQEDKIVGGIIKMPKFRMTTSKDKALEGTTDTAKSDTETEGSKLKLKLPKVGISSKSAETDAELEMEGLEGRGKESKLKMFGLCPGKDQKGEVGESGQAEGDSEAAKFKVKIPSVTVAAPKIKGPDADLNVNFPKGKDTSANHEMKVVAKEGRGEISVPVISSESRFKMPKLTMPDFGMSGNGRKDDDGVVTGKAKVSEMEFRRSKGEAAVEGSDVDAEGKLQILKVKMPKVEIGFANDEPSTGEKAEIGAGQKPGGDVTGSGAMPAKVPFKMPSVEISSPKTSDLCAGIEEGAGDVGLPLAEGKGTLSEADADVVELKVPKVTLPSFGSSKEKVQGTPGDRSGSGAKIDVKGPQVQVEAGDVSESMLSKLKNKMSNVGVEFPSGKEGEGEGSSAATADTKGRAVSSKAGVGLQEPEAGLKTDKTRKQLLGFSVSKPKSPEERAKTKVRDRSRSPATEGRPAEAKPKTSKVKMPGFEISWPKGKTVELNGNGEPGDSTKRGEWEARTPRKKGAGAEEAGEPDSPDARSKMKLKLPKVSFTPIKSTAVNIMTGEEPTVHVNGDSEESGSPGKMGRIKLPKVEFSSPYQKVKDSDNELNLQLVKTEMSASKDEAHPNQSFKTSSPRANREDVRGSKIKAPKISFSGFKKKSGEKGGSDEDTEMSNLVTSTARTELVSQDSRGDTGHTKSKSILGFTSGKSKDPLATGREPKAKGSPGDEREPADNKDKPAKFRLPKLSLGNKSSSLEHESNAHLEGQQESEEGPTRVFKLQMPKVGFTTIYQEQASEEKIVGEISSVVVSKSRRQAKAGASADKSTSI